MKSGTKSRSRQSSNYPLYGYLIFSCLILFSIFTAAIPTSTLVIYLSKGNTSYLNKVKFLQSITVKVIADYSSGTGVLITRKISDVTKTFVLTAAHVVDGLKNTDGTFREALIYREYRVNGFKVSNEEIPAIIIAYDRDNDIAILEVNEDNYTTEERTCEFYLQDKIPPPGTTLIHVGCTFGHYNSVMPGIMSQTYVFLPNIPESNGKVFDQTSIPAFPGSSGGGVFLENGQYVGMVTLWAGYPCLNWMVPVRRIQEWTRSIEMEWIIDPSIPVPTERKRTELEKMVPEIQEKDLNEMCIL